MDRQRPETGLRWTEGRGAIGMAWRTGEVQLVTGFGAVVEQARNPDDDAFLHDLSEDERTGLTRREVLQAPHYEAMLAYPLRGEPEPDEVDPPVVGILSVDFKVDVDQADLDRLLEDDDFGDVLGSCENYLRETSGATPHA